MIDEIERLLSRGIRWAKENPLATLVIAGFAIWFIVTLALTELSDRWGFAPKTFWDWMDLLIVPLVLAFGALWFNTSQKRTEIAIANDKQHQDILLDYFDEMTVLLLKEYSVGATSEEGGEQEKNNFSELAVAIAKARTLAVLRVLDPDRVAAVLRFHVEAKLAEAVPLAKGNLKGVDWHGASLWDVDLREIDLSEADLSGVVLIYANLSGAYLIRADLSGAFLIQANLSEAFMPKANLSGANLGGANLSGANLLDANLRGANLSGANLSGASLRGVVGLTPKQLHRAKSLENTTMPDGTKYEEWIKKQENQQFQDETNNHASKNEEEE